MSLTNLGFVRPAGIAAQELLISQEDLRAGLVAGRQTVPQAQRMQLDVVIVFAKIEILAEQGDGFWVFALSLRGFRACLQCPGIAFDLDAVQKMHSNPEPRKKSKRNHDKPGVDPLDDHRARVIGLRRLGGLRRRDFSGGFSTL